MAEQEPILAHPGSQEMTSHVKSYDKFIWMMKWGAVACFILGIIIIAFVL